MHQVAESYLPGVSGLECQGWTIRTGLSGLSELECQDWTVRTGLSGLLELECQDWTVWGLLKTQPWCLREAGVG